MRRPRSNSRKNPRFPGRNALRMPVIAPALLDEMQQLALKHELLKFAEYSLQAMGYYAK